ncbi:hypothetical protein [Chryseobacterium polytrichastri]|uniref:Uncharacterized protein n=1 Tax=Chryseobacterium polytrichastri TaxID=1302687 RepID=A0A1M7DLS3_9FLAO|nr:hypothetical protein [Chryseobacterium polytrichastri]SHL80119.1 hypothetical protein SAMN05444267_102530 [Chryseobacterium polytrichastri]
MIFPKAKKIAKDLGWHKTNDSVFGLYKGYFFNVSDASLITTPQFKLVTATTGNITEEQKLQIKTELNLNKRKLKFTLFEISDNEIFFKFTENVTLTQLKTVYSLFDFLVDLFKKLNVSEQNKCHNCGTNQKINYYTLNDTGIILCTTCFYQKNNSFYEIEKERISKEKNYLTGFLGSIVFSIPGIIFWILFAVYLGRIASGMAFVIIFTELLGYDYFKGKHGKLTKYIISLTNIISIIIANIMTVIVLFVKQGLTINHAILELQTNQAITNLFYQNIIISFIFSLFAWIWILFIMKDKKLVIKLADKL